MMFPSTNKVLADRINERIDNPDPKSILINNMINNTYRRQGHRKNPFDTFNLMRGHRKQNHDLMSAMLVGAIEARKNNMPMQMGFMSAYSHLATDNFSNYLIRNMGIEGRNLYESLFNYVTRR
jgi:hypothetical protein